MAGSLLNGASAMMRGSGLRLYSGRSIGVMLTSVRKAR